MKNPFILLTILVALALQFQSCEKKDAIVTTTNGSPGVLSATATTLVLQKTSAADTAKVIRFNFTKADYGFSSVVTNVIQIDKTSDNWLSPSASTLGANVLSQGYSTADLNSLLKKLGVVAGVATPIQVRIMYSASTYIKPVYSNTIMATVTTY
ncbi:SusE domain-containing protein [Pedobacter sp. L105]|uniref:SusE domain-containing protein n=1 Tax=Pedobacter sp. L105 TaxID=1641871 RepID=UPI00131BF324|nr:SusE domain-containing protein [Pedobacter sp. L105]